MLEVLGLLDNLDDRVAIVRNMRGSKPVLGHNLKKYDSDALYN